MSDEGLRDMPSHDEEAEFRILGAIMLDGERALDAVLAEFGEEPWPEIFYVPRHAVVFAEIMDMRRRGVPLGIDTLAAELRARGVLEEVGGPLAVAKLVDLACAAANVPYHAKRILGHFRTRRASLALRQAAESIRNEREDVGERLERARRIVTEGTRAPERGGPVPIRDLIIPTLDEISRCQEGKFSGVPWGFRELDDVTHGLHKGELTVVAARTSVGKSTFAINVLRLLAEGGRPVALCSLEMDRTQVVGNLLCSVARVNSHHARKKDGLSREDRDRLDVAADTVSKWNFAVDCPSYLTLSKLETRARRLKAERGIEVLVIDYLQLLAAERGERRNRQEVVSEFSRNLKVLAGELELPIVALAQLNRQVEARESKRPRLSDLRESGAIEQDSACVVFLWEGDEEDEPRENELTVTVAKNRYGPRDVDVRLFYRRAWGFFGDPEGARR